MSTPAEDPRPESSPQTDAPRGYDPAAEVVEICRDLIRIDTSNYGDQEGPGERKAAEHVAALLDEVGIASQLFESEPGRTSVVARWGGTEGDALLLHGHLDVVPAAAEDWQVHPFSGEVQDGYVWGRGAVDMKDFDAMLLSVVRARQRAGRIPSRPIVLCFTADEEAGGHKGAEILVRDHPELFEGVTEAVGEVGGFSVTVRGRRMYLVEAAEKGMAWMRLTARGRAGHGSMLNTDNAVSRLTAAVARIGAHDWPVRLTPTMEVLLASVGDLAGVQATPENAPDLIEEFGGAARMLGAVISNTTNPTMLQAGYKVNVIPTEATAHVDGRFLPGFEDEFFATLAELVGEGVEIEHLSHQQPWETPYDGDLVRAMNRSILSEDPGGIVAPYLMSGGTDAKHFRKLGMRSYGFAPLRLPADLDFTALFHGVDERVPVDALEFGARVFDTFLDDV
ncbi:acetylornithine deacetylase/succinyl-diaminopimelate desuccinylase-like protein [Nocardioides marinisabuli]|uniref:Acetylornithine deacetylase/succinyl-diaminopimelate desuccinylase-like protein n=1 Tax=Nocardioides marinisabuli TaxID=419476 RepID=A0A7Y9F3Q7_9ACTN|nr:M20/M25/M40 family metallo-hydrolase [Nocardioides marinisabuli]NYD59069.1 acetylornithine deacetylase/succinyl-diaminopimelate desuccinylase-like protein [Nocardioides marinisabuli]